MKKINLIFFHPYSGLGGADRSIARVINNLDQNIFNFHFITISKPNIKLFLKKKVFFHKINSTRTLFSIFKIRRILKNINDNKKKNIFVSNQNFANILSFLILINFKNFKHILIERNSLDELSYSKNFHDFFKKKIIKYFIKILYKYSDLVICISKKLSQEIKEYTGAKTKIIYNPALDNSIFEKNLKYSKIKSNKNIIINVARLEIQKDQITLLRAFKNIQDKKNFKLMIIGYGSCYVNLKNFIQQNRLQKNVKIIRKIKNAHSYLKKAKLFVLCSKYEGFGNVLIEAGINKIPIISSNCKHGPTEILKNGKYGDLFQVGDHRELTRKIKNFINNPQKLIKKTNKFYKSLKRFNTKKIIIEYEKSFLNV